MLIARFVVYLVDMGCTLNNPGLWLRNLSCMMGLERGVPLFL